MKKLFAIALMVCTALSVDAQILSSSSSMSTEYIPASTPKQKPAKKQKKEKSGYNLINLSVGPMVLTGDTGDGLESFSFDLGYDHGWKIAKRYPLFIESGIHTQWGFGDLWTGNFAIPVNIAYAKKFGKRGCISPFTGFRLKLNAVSCENEYETGSGMWWDYDYEDSKVAQIDWQMGVNLSAKRFNFQVAYRHDCTAFFGHSGNKIWSLLIGFGTRF